MKTKILFLFAILVLSWNAQAQEQKMSAQEITNFRALVEKESKNIKSLKTDFVQYKHLDFLSKDIETSGEMFFKSPNWLNWKYTKPYQYSIVFKNNKVLINDQGNKSSMDVGNSKIFEKINKMIIGSVSGNMFDDKEYTISYFKTKEHNITKLIPKSESIKKYIAQIDLYFPIGESTVAQVKLIEPSKDYTRIVFKNKVINAKIDDAVFNN